MIIFSNKYESNKSFSWSPIFIFLKTKLFKIIFILLIYTSPVLAGDFCIDSVNSTTAITLNITTINSTCQKANGKLIVLASGGVAPYSLNLVNSLGVIFYNTGNTFTSLPPDTYTLTVTDAIGTLALQNVVLNNTFSAPLANPIAINAPSVCNSYDGVLVLSASNGTAPYLYSVDNINFQASNTFNNLTSGVYHYLIKDANGCSPIFLLGQDVVSIPHSSICPFGIVNGGSIASIGCNPFSLQIQIPFPVGGTPPFNYSLDGINYQTSNIFPNLSEGIITVSVKDAEGLIVLYSVSWIDECEATFLITTNVVQALCGINGSITVNAFLGEAPYQYSIDGINFQSSNQFTGLASGSYTITVKDAYDFINSKYVIVPNNCLQVIPTSTSSTCGNSNGKIIAQASNGVAPYEYSINGGFYSSSNVFNNLAANNYVVRAKDATNRVAIANTIVSNIAGAQIIAADTTATGCSNNTGAITVQAQAGTLPYLYSIDGTNFQNTGLFTGLAQNSYTVTVKDARGCLTTKPALIKVNSNLFVDAGDTVKICEGKTGLTNAVSDAATFSWLPTVGLNNANALNPMASPTQTTTYFLTGTKGVCTKTDSVLVFVKPAPIANAGLGATICFGQNAMLQAAAGQAVYTWQPSTYLTNANSALSDVIKPKNNITYALSVVGANGCTSLQDGQVTIKVTPPPKVFVGNDTSIAIGEPLIMQAIDVNGSGFNQFAWQPFYLLNDAAVQYPLIQNIQSNTMFSVTATTVAGCVGLDSVNIKVFDKPDIYVPNAFTPNADGNNDVLRAIPVGIRLFKFFTVYDRYGRQIFNTNNPENGWDGKTNGSLNNTGSFIWITAGIDYAGRIVERKGAVVLVR